MLSKQKLRTKIENVKNTKYKTSLLKPILVNVGKDKRKSTSLKANFNSLNKFLDPFDFNLTLKYVVWLHLTLKYVLVLTRLLFGFI